MTEEEASMSLTTSPVDEYMQRVSPKPHPSRLITQQAKAHKAEA
jgi:hypothetical protein